MTSVIILFYYVYYTPGRCKSGSTLKRVASL